MRTLTIPGTGLGATLRAGAPSRKQVETLARSATRTLGSTDPRHYQIAVLCGLLLYGLARLDLEVRPARALLILTSALLTQYLCTRLFRLPLLEPRSALISGLSLCLLLRTNSPLLAGLAGATAIASKFLVRWKGKHVFNPTNFAIVLLMALTGEVWVSPAQWGSAVYFAFLLACLGGLVVHRAARSDISIALLTFWAAIVLGRALWLGDPAAIPLRQMQSGSLLIFAFFMISDPRTTPNSRAGRVSFALLVALGAGVVQFGLYRTNGLLWSLACLSPLVPLIDRVLPAARFSWKSPLSTPPATLHFVPGPVPEPVFVPLSSPVPGPEPTTDLIREPEPGCRFVPAPECVPMPDPTPELVSVPTHGSPPVPGPASTCATTPTLAFEPASGPVTETKPARTPAPPQVLPALIRSQP